MQDSVVQVRVENLAEMKHLVGDFFVIEHIWPTTMVQMDCFQRLLSLPGVFMITFDNCPYGELYRHRQVLITNLPILAQLSRNCGDLPPHRHAVVGVDVPTGAVSPFSQAFCDEYAKLLKRTVHAPHSRMSARTASERSPSCSELRNPQQRYLRPRRLLLWKCPIWRNCPGIQAGAGRPLDYRHSYGRTLPTWLVEG